MQVGKIISANQSVLSKTKKVLKESQNIANPLMQNIAQPKNLPMTTKPAGGQLVAEMGMALVGGAIVLVIQLVAIRIQEMIITKIENKNKINSKKGNEQSEAQDNKVKEYSKTDMENLKNEMNISGAEAAELYKSQMSCIFNENQGQDEGLNKLVGQHPLKLGLAKNLLVPLHQIANGEKNEADVKKLPNAICFFGPKGTGKTYLCEAIQEQYKLSNPFSTPKKIKFDYYNPDADLKNIKNIFMEAKENFIKSKGTNYTLLLVDEMEKNLVKDGLPGANPKRNVLLKSYMANCKDNGVIMLLTSNDLSKVDEGFLTTNTMSVPIEPLGLQDIMNTITYNITKEEIDDSQVDYKELEKAIETEKISYKPKGIENAIQRVRYSYGPLTTKKLKDSLWQARSDFTDKDKEQLDDEIEYIRKNGKLCNNARFE